MINIAELIFSSSLDAELDVIFSLESDFKRTITVSRLIITWSILFNSTWFLPSCLSFSKSENEYDVLANSLKDFKLLNCSLFATPSIMSWVFILSIAISIISNSLGLIEI